MEIHYCSREEVKVDSIWVFISEEDSTDVGQN
jgi:hypothetical protein